MPGQFSLASACFCFGPTHCSGCTSPKVFILLTGWGGIRLGVKTGLFEHHAVALVPQVGAEHPVTITAASPQLTMLLGPVWMMQLKTMKTTS